ncbi:GDSL-type esterase/lipase family protein [Desulforamulus ruminis]|uniref:Lipolytic protein G-D-S-L family n=1 Tax=Desulforamulus ruminis (strain ATCC 23193 / DSM 2154 / NCIMB 8452 / DL) TaxID=696281 RepID=F6DNH1_DESRL|nr:GDSL-type esterase/lipase family protein [Desulforamulus ruminis]AEG61862.1 lipolytic protein G-D-S-L family [Desulforamulus ruminis DSM 2154]
MKRTLSLILLLVFLQTLSFPMAAQAKYQDWDRYVARYQEENKYLQYEGGVIVLLGDSLTEFFPLDELRKRYNIINRGIRMDAVADADSRLKASVLDAKPQTVLIMLGTNDVCAYWLEPEEVVKRYRSLLERIQTELPETKIVVQSVLLTRDANYNNYIRPINDGLVNLCREMNIAFLDHNPGLIEGDRLGAKFTTDGIHLSQAGYDLLADNIRKYLSSPVQVVYQGKLVFSSTNKVKEEREVLVNLRSFALDTGGTVLWTEDGKVRFIKGNREFEWGIGSDEMLDNGEEVLLPTPPEIIDNNVYVPLAPLTECLGYTLVSSEDKKFIAIQPSESKSSLAAAK